MRKHNLIQSFRNAFRGLGWMVLNERNFKIEIAATAANLPLIVLLKLNHHDSAVILTLCALVLSLEIINTAIEKMCDFVHPGYDARIGLIKDLAAGAVLLASIFAIIAGIVTYSSYFPL